MKTLTREKGQRMWGGGGSGSGSSGGGISASQTASMLSGYAEQSWVEDNFISIEFFSRLFQAYNGTTLVSPNDTETTIDNIKAMFGFWTEQYVSALGKNSSGGSGGGGASALSDLVDVALSNPSSGQALIFDGTHWTNGTVTSGTVTSVGMSVPTGFDVSGSPITGSGTLALTFASGYSLPTTAKQSNWDTAYGWGNHAIVGYLKSVSFSDLTSHPTTLAGYGITDGVANTATWWGQQISGGSVSGSLSSVDNITMSGSINMAGSIFMNGGNVNINGGSVNDVVSIEMNTGGTLSNYGGFIDFHYDGASGDYTSRIIEEWSGTISFYTNAYIPGYLQIGSVRLVYDSANNALKVMSPSGGTANFYATGAVLALGYSD